MSVAELRSSKLLSALGKPLSHHGDLTFLSGHYLFGEPAHFGSGTMFEDDASHVDGALMVGDHAAHEIHICIACELNAHIGVHLVVGLGVGADDGIVGGGARAVPGMLTLGHGFSLSLLADLRLRVGESTRDNHRAGDKYGREFVHGSVARQFTVAG